MFNALRREIEEILGDDFAVFFEYSTNPRKNDKILDEYKNVGVLHINYGDIKLLPNNQGMTGALQLDLLMTVKDGVELESVVSKPLYDLISKHNGVLYPNGTGIIYSYVLNYHLPTSDGEEKITKTKGTRYVKYSLPIDVTLAASSLMLGEQFDIKLNSIALKNVVNAVVNPKLTLDPHTYVKGNVTKSSATARVWGMQVNCLFDVTDELHNAIYKALNENPETVWEVQYSLDGTNYTTRNVLLFESTVTFERGQFAVLNLNMCEAG